METAFAACVGALVYWWANKYRVDSSLPGFGGVVVFYAMVAILTVVAVRSALLGDLGLAAFSVIVGLLIAGFAEWFTLYLRRSQR